MSVRVVVASDSIWPMPPFVLSLRDSQKSLDGEPNATWLIGVPTGEGNFAVGDQLSVPLNDGTRTLATVVGFPLFGSSTRPGRLWRSVEFGLNKST